MTSSSSSSSSCCPPGSHGSPKIADWEGKPQGSFLTIGSNEGSRTPIYYTGPKGESSANSNENNNIALIVYTDVWGFKSRLPLICDKIAAAIPNLHIVVPDCFRGNTKDNHPPFKDMVEWFQNTSWEKVVKDDTQNCLNFLKNEKGVSVMDNTISTMGYCWGCWAFAKASSVGFIKWKTAIGVHPSFKVEKMAFNGNDIDLMVNGIHCPTLLLPGGNDPNYMKPNAVEFQAFVENQPGSKSIEFPEMNHGWTTRSDLNDPKMLRDVNLALKYMIDHLKATYNV